MTPESIIVLLIVGLIAGWLAGLIWKGSGFGLLWNLIFGVCGSFLGGWLSDSWVFISDTDGSDRS